MAEDLNHVFLVGRLDARYGANPHDKWLYDWQTFA